MEGWVRDLQPDFSWWGGHRVGRPRKPMTSSTLPPFSPPYPGSRILQPPMWLPCTLACPTWMPCTCPRALVPCLALPALLLCLTCSVELLPPVPCPIAC